MNLSVLKSRNVIALAEQFKISQICDGCFFDVSVSAYLIRRQ